MFSILKLTVPTVLIVLRVLQFDQLFVCWRLLQFSFGEKVQSPKFSVGGWMWEEEHKGVIKGCQVIMNESHSVHSQEI